MNARFINAGIAGLLSLLFGSFTYWALLALHQESQVDNNLIILPRGDTYFGVYQPDKKDCVGQIKVTVEPETDDFQITANAKVLAKINNNLLPVNLSLKLSFSVLGQLGLGLLTISADQTIIKISMSDINPINVTTSIVSNQQERQFRLSIPGPVEFRDHGHDKYTIIAPSGIMQNSQSSLLLEQPLVKKLLPVTKQLESESICPVDAAHALDLSSLESLANNLSQFAPDLGN